MIRQAIRSRIKGYSILFGSAYFIFLLILTIFQKNFLFMPDAQQISPARVGLSKFESITIQTSDNEQLVSWYKKPVKNGKVILFFHGNGGNNPVYNQTIKELEPLADGFLIIDYRGFGGSTGTPSAEGLFKDAEAALKYLEEQGIKPEQLIISGISLGTGLAVHVAQKTQASAVILIAAYSSLADIIKDRFFFYPGSVLDALLKNDINAIEKISKIKTPLVIVHGTKDTVISYSLAKKLYSAANEPKMLISLPGYDHVLPVTNETLSQIREFLNSHWKSSEE